MSIVSTFLGLAVFNVSVKQSTMANPSIVDGGYPPLAPVQNGSARFVPKIRLSDEKHARLPFPAEKRFSFLKITL